MNNTCEDCRIAVTTDGIEIDSSQGDIILESILLGVIVFVIAALYIGKKWIDRKFR
jgi:hypothetical protein